MILAGSVIEQDEVAAEREMEVRRREVHPPR